LPNPRANTRNIVLVAGASSGIGLATVQSLHAQGFCVYGASRRRPDGEIPWLTMDVNDDASVASGIAAIIEAEGRIDALVNCAGFGIAGAIEDTSIDEARAQFETNFFGAMRTCRAVLPTMRAQKHGLIINIGSLAGLIAVPFQGLYSASKFALEGFSEALRMEVKKYGIDIAIVEPGDFKTGFTASRIRVTAADAPSPYFADCERALQQMEKDESTGLPASHVAELVQRIIETPHPRLRYRVGKTTQKAAVGLKHILPETIFEALVMQSFHVPRQQTP
jgi:short-subunit dehydrogenase